MTNRHEKLTIRMLGENVTFERHQWEWLLEELDEGGSLHSRICIVLTTPQYPITNTTKE